MSALSNFDALLSVLNGVETARKVSVACLTLNLWDIVTTLDEEIAFFWSGRWTVSRALFLFNRYLPPAVSIVIVYCFFGSDLSPEVLLSYSFVVGVSTVQVVLVIRIWYLFHHSRAIRFLAVGSFVIAAILSFVFVVLSFPFLISSEQIDIPGTGRIGCSIPAPRNFWRLFLPALILHTLLFVFTVLRAFRTPKVFRDAPLMRRLLRDGGVFYFIVVVIVGFSAISAFFVNAYAVNLTAIYSGLVLTVTSVAISRLMLNIRTLADRLGYDEKWIFSNIEIERLNWKKGLRDGEITVEVGHREFEPCEDDATTVAGTPRSRAGELLELGDLESCSGRGSESGIRVTRVGELPNGLQGGVPAVADW
ncbi:hypothetical protein V5O48_003555 [Marasmius crinis-equi]|uniref:DUF6533 domain-containing protein n=1 Tax=Marasmius crinis-equi TaxID=585013 RepID=A0ABR3FSM3_9AGAR